MGGGADAGGNDPLPNGCGDQPCNVNTLPERKEPNAYLGTPSRY